MNLFDILFLVVLVALVAALAFGLKALFTGGDAARAIAGAMRSTVNVGMFHGGHNTNVVPSACTVEIDRRLLPNEKVKDAFKELKKVVDGVGAAQAQRAEAQDRVDRPVRSRAAGGAKAARLWRGKDLSRGGACGWCSDRFPPAPWPRAVGRPSAQSSR